ncbi:hypothetical protein PM8797T_02684 [Gimesia maris DSM 8797]|nr:hypothetical protein PM8797T_02684 [Gimesia maris DSM 8797]
MCISQTDGCFPVRLVPGPIFDRYALLKVLMVLF